MTDDRIEEIIEHIEEIRERALQLKAIVDGIAEGKVQYIQRDMVEADG